MIDNRYSTILKQLNSPKIENREFAFNYGVKSYIGEKEFLKNYLKSLRDYHFEHDPFLIQKLILFCHPEVKNSKDNFIELINFFQNIPDGTFRNQFFNIIFQSKISYQKEYFKFIEKYFSEVEMELIDEEWKRYETLSTYSIDELFLEFFNFFHNKDQVLFTDLNHRHINSIIEIILKFPKIEQLGYIESSFRENPKQYYLIGYLVQLSSFLKDDDLVPYLAEFILKIPNYDQFLSNFFSIWRSELFFKKIVQSNKEFIKYLPYFDNKLVNEIIDLENFNNEKHRYQELIINTIIDSLDYKHYTFVKNWVKNNPKREYLVTKFNIYKEFKEDII